MAMNDASYIVSGGDVTSNSGLIYSPKKWQDNEKIDRVEMNNIEQGIQIALESRTELETISAESLQRIEDYYNNVLNPAINSVNSQIASLPTTIQTEVNNNLSTNNQNIISSFINLLGANYVEANANTLPLSLPNQMATVDSRLTSLASSFSSINTNFTDLNTYVRGTNNLNSISNQVLALQNELGGGGSGTSFKEKIENALGRALEPTAEEIAEDANVNSSLLELIENLQGVLGLSSSAEGEPSLIEKIESALGRPLTPTAAEIQEDELIEDSLLDLIKDIRGTLGMSGGTSGGQSNLIEKINAICSAIYGGNETSDLGTGYTLSKVLDDLYGELIENSSTGIEERSENPLINTLKNLPSSFNTLSTRVGSVETSNNKIETDIATIKTWQKKIEDAYVDADSFILQEDEKTYLRLTRVNKDVPTTVQEMQADLDNTYIQLPEGGGGGASTGGGTAAITRITDTSVQILIGNQCFIEYKLEARDTSNELVGNGVATWYVGGVQVATSTALNITEADNTITNSDFDISPYLSVGANNIILQVSVNTGGEYPTIVRKTWTVNVVNFSLVWNYNETTIFDNGFITLEWIPYGAGINKTTHIYIDKGTENEIHLTQTTLQSGITQTYTFEHNLSHGVHTCEIYLTATINGKNETTNSQFHDLIVVEPGNTTPIISSSPLIEIMVKKQNGEYVQEMEQYDTVAIPIVVYTPNATLTDNVVLTADGVVVNTWNDVDRRIHYWNYSAYTIGTRVLTVSVGSITKTITIEVISISIDNEEVSGYDFKIKASDIISNIDLRNNELLTFSNNFDWINGGIKSERDSNNNIQQYICIKAGTTMTVNKQLFNSSLPNGLDFKIILKTANCSDYDAKILDCYSNDIGIELFAHKGILKSSGRSVTTQYGENTYIELDFEVYGTNDDPRYMMCWVDGVMSIVRVCSVTDQFEQTSKANITIGSTNCDVYVYLIKNYYKKLSIDEHIANFIADAPNATTMKARYNRNNILDDDNDIDYEKLIKAAPDCRVWLYDIHRMTTGKKDKVKVYKFQQFWDNGGDEYHNGLYAENAIMTVQGTSSVNYRKGAANTDINFTGNDCILRSASGENLLANELEHKGMKINDNSVPITYANLKVNFASCEQVNNMCNAMWYQNFQPYPSLSNRDCMEFAMGVQFIHDRGLDEPTVEDPTTKQQMQEIPLFSEKPRRDANKYYMYSIGNLGNSKKNTDIFHSENECCIEVNDNTTEGQRMITWPENMDWTGDDETKDQSYGMRYPDTKTPNKMITDGWERFVRWMAANNPNAATNEPIEEENYPIYTFRGHHREGTQVLRGTTVSQYAGTYTTDSFNRRMAKMLSECEDYMAMDSVVYHFCYIERHTMVDNVAKNTFWSSAKTNQYINGIEQENTEGYWIWDLSKNYDNDTSDGNNNEGQLVFDYGNEANDSINGKMVFNASDAVWFIFISHLTEACATMFIDRETAQSNDGQYKGAWNSLLYHNFLLKEQQKIPERVWNECYWYDYLRTYEKNIDRSWISFLDGGQKIQQRRHYETFQELYLASKYMSPLSIGNMITMRGYTPTITENMTEEQKNIIRATLAAVPSKSEVTVTMYNKCYLTVHMGNNFLQRKVSKGEPTTLTFRESNGNYLGLMDTVINIDTASMIQEIGDLSPLYPGQSSFGAAYRLRSIKIGSPIEGYQNLNISATETGAFDFSTNTMLERLEIQNLKAVQAALNLDGCPALKYLDASGSSFTGYSFADGGLINVAKLGNPNTIVMKNLSYLTDENLILDSALNLRYLTIDNCPLIDSFNRVQTLNSLLLLNLLNVNWQVQGVDFNNFVNYIKEIPSYLITGEIKLTPEMGTFNIGDLGNTFTKDLKFYYYNINDPEAVPQPYHTVSFYGLYGNDFIRNQYIPSGGKFIGNNFGDYFTEQYIKNYNIFKNSSWQEGADTRLGFGSWSVDSDIPVTSDLDVYAEEENEYKLTYIMHTADPEVFLSNRYTYYKEGEIISKLTTDDVPPFVRDYYKYTYSYWTASNNTNMDPTAAQESVPAIAIKEPYAEIWYAVYQKNPNIYTVSVYNVDRNGNKQGEPLITLSKKVVSTSNSENRVSFNELKEYRPGIGSLAKNQAIYINDTTMYQSDIEQENEEDRLYRFLDWKPYVSSTTGVQVTGDMDILATYYKTDDIFTNYFLNKLTNCTLSDDIQILPEGAFLHNSNLTKLTTKATSVGKGSFSYFTNNTRRIFVFTNNNVTFDNYCFYNLNNCLIIFTGNGNISVNDYAFDGLRNCIIIVQNSDEPIHTNGSLYNCFNSFYGNNNFLYVTSNAYNRYRNNNITDNIPNNLNGEESYLSIINIINDNNIQEFLREADLV